MGVFRTLTEKIAAPIQNAVIRQELNLSGLMVQGDSLLWSKHIDAHVWSGSVVGVKEALIPSVQLLVVLGRFL